MKIAFSYASQDAPKLMDWIAYIRAKEDVFLCLDSGVEPPQENLWKRQQYLHQADVWMLVISSASLQSYYCKEEWKYALERCAKGELLCAPIVLDSCDWTTESLLKDIIIFMPNLQDAGHETYYRAWDALQTHYSDFLNKKEQLAIAATEQERRANYQVLLNAERAAQQTEQKLAKVVSKKVRIYQASKPFNLFGLLIYCILGQTMVIITLFAVAGFKHPKRFIDDLNLRPAQHQLPKETHHYTGYDAENGVSIFKDGKYCLVDAWGKELAPCIYDYPILFSNGLACVKKEGKWGFINERGKEVIPFIYNAAYPVSEGFICVKKGAAWGFLNTKGEEMIPFIYDQAYQMSHGLASVQQNGKWGFVNKTGEVVIAFLYDKFAVFEHTDVGIAAQVQQGDQLFYIDPTGKCVKDCK